MANQPETSSWSTGVYQWEVTDPAQGGIGGVMNTPILQLASRTRWLKDQVDTLTANIAGGAALNSPAFIGNPTAPTAAPFDNDTSIATTAFVQRALGNFASVDSYASSFTLTAAQVGRGILYYGGADATGVLPLFSTCPTGASFLFHNISASNLTVQRQGSDLLLGVYGATSVVLGPGDSLVVVQQGAANQWMVAGGSAQYRYSYSATLKANTSGTYAGMSVGYATNSSNADTVDGWHRDDIRAWGSLLNVPSLVYPDGGTYPINITGYAATAGNASTVSSVSTAQVLGATAGAAAGGVGTYVFGAIASTGVRIGSIYAGSEIQPSGVYATSVLPPDTAASGTQSALVTGSSYLTGSWMAMGTVAHNTYNCSRATLFLRIA